MEEPPRDRLFPGWWVAAGLLVAIAGGVLLCAM
jgi:hypothetical protein